MNIGTFVMFDLRHHPAGLVPTAGLIEKVMIPDHRLVGRTADGTCQKVLNLPVQHGVGRKADRVQVAFGLQVLVEFRPGEGGVASEGPVPARRDPGRGRRPR